ncbi:MAG: hypothetical protein FJ399_03435, partial [Verrucomicrobia bacterium]|nr:hypothetical protein [Verrucomicrobiota bacterium]
MRTTCLCLPAVLAALLAATALRADSSLDPRPTTEIFFETRTRVPKVAGVEQLTPGPAGQQPVFYRRLSFGGERHSATAPLQIRGTNSQTVLQYREMITGVIQHRYDWHTDSIVVENLASIRSGSANTPPWEYTEQNWPKPPVLTEVIPLTSVSPVGYDPAFVALNNPLGLTVRSANRAADDNVFGGSVGGYNGIAATEFQYDWLMVLDDLEDSTEVIEQRSRVTVVAGQRDEHVRSTVRETRRPTSRSWMIREVTVSYRILDCPGDYLVRTTYRRRNLGNSSDSWGDPWSVTEVVRVKSANDQERIFEIPVERDYEIQLVGIEAMPLEGCGDGCGPNATAGGTAGPKSGSIFWLIPLGVQADGGSAGALFLHRPNLSAEIYTPAALTPALTTGQPLTDSLGRLRQILVPQALVDVVVLSPQAYELRFYDRSRAGTTDASGLHAPSGSPYLTWRVENPAGPDAAPNKLRVTRLAGGESLVTEIDESQPGRRVFSEAGGLRITETTASAWTGDRVEDIVVKNAAGQVASRRQAHYRRFAWGDEKVREVLDPDGAALVTEWTYGTTPNRPAYRQIIRLRRPDGFEERTNYDDQGYSVVRVLPAWANSTQEVARNLRVVDLDGDGVLDRLTTNSTWVFLTALNLDWTVEWGALSASGQRLRDRFQATASAASWDAPGNLRTRERYSPNDGELVYRLGPDGILTLRNRETDAAGNSIATEQRGAPDAAREAVVDGTRTVTVTSPRGRMLSTVVTDLASGRTIDSLVVAASDESGRPTRLVHLDGAIETREYCAPCGEVSATSLRGVTTEYLYDALGRRTDEVLRAGTTTLSHQRTRYDAEGRILQTIRFDRATGTETVLSATVYDLAGRVVAETALGQGTTTYSHAFGADHQTIVTTTQADGGTRVETRAPGGALLRVRGTAVPPVDYQYAARSWDGRGDGYLLTIRHGNDNGTAATEEQSINLLGQVEAIRYPGNATRQRFFDAGGRLVREVDPDGVTVLHEYDAQGRPAARALDVNRNGRIDYAGPDRISRTRSEIGVRDGATVRRATVEQWEAENSESPVVVAVIESSVDGLRAWRTVRGLTSTSATVHDGAGEATVTTTAPDGAVLERVLLGERLLRETTRHPALGVLAAAAYSYDSAGRLATVTDARGGTTTQAYDAHDRLVSVTGPDPDPTRTGPGYDPQTTTYGYDAMGRVTSVTAPDGTATTTTYHPTGQVRRSSGPRTTPVEYTYDVRGRPKTMTTWQDFAGDSGRAVTTWDYDDERGWLSGKRHADGRGPGFAYSPAGRLARRTWARGVVTTYTYDAAGDLRTTTYSDGTPSVTLDYDRAGRLKNASDGSGVRSFSYNAAGQLAAETYTAGLLGGAALARTGDSLQRLSGLAVSLGSPLLTASYGYDAASRLQSVASGPHAAAYAYLPNSNLVETLTRATNGTVRLRTTNTYDAMNRLAATTSGPPGAAPAVSYHYTYNAANQRSRTTREFGSSWNYSYDSLGQVTGGRKLLADGTPALGLDFAWGFDDIGNRRTATANGLTSAYSANAVNQYTQRTVPPVVEVLGTAAADAQVVVSGAGVPQFAQRQGETFFKQLPADNTETARALSLQIAAVRDPTGAALAATSARSAFVPQSPEQYSHDADGNLVADGRWSFSWDAENRLIALETRPAAAAVGAPRQRLEFTYDGLGRRVKKKSTSHVVSGLIDVVTTFHANETLGDPPARTVRGGEIDGNWAAEPAPGLPADGWSQRVTARLRVPADGNWIFSVPLRGDDAVRLFLDGQPVLNAWIYGLPAPSATVQLQAGRDYALRYEFKDGGGAALSQLRWSGPGVAEQVVPSAANAAFGAQVAETRFLHDGWNLLAEIDSTGRAVR